MKILYALTLTCFFVADLIAQHDDITTNRVRQTLSTGKVSTMPTGMRTLPLEAGETKGNHYLQSDLVATNFVMLSDDVYEGFPAKYNIKGNFFAVEYDGEIKYLEGDLLKAFTYIDPENNKRRIFLNEKVLPNTVELIKGFWEIHYNGAMVKLVSKKETELIEANYNVALDVGDRDSKIKKNDIFYLLVNSEYRKIEKFRKKYLHIFGEKEKQMADFIKDNKLEADTEEDLVKVAEYYEELLSST